MREIGAFSRVVPNGRGSDFVLTQFFADDMRDADLADQRAIVAVELQTVRALCERAAASDVIGATVRRC